MHQKAAASMAEGVFPADDLPDVDVCIVGAGPVGASLACRLGRAGLSVAVLDRAELAGMEHPDLDGRPMLLRLAPSCFWKRPGCGMHCPVPLARSRIFW